MKDLKNNELMTISGGNRVHYYGGGTAITISAKLSKKVGDGDKNRNKMKKRRAKWNSRGGNYRW